jgi:signal transduction histidine kinase
MRERLAQVGGRLTIESEPGRTCVRASIPLPHPGFSGGEAEGKP